MRSTFLFLLIALMAACSPGSPDATDGNDNPTDTIEDDVVETIYDPAVSWAACGSGEGDHPCNIIATDHNGDEFDLYANYGSLVVLDLSTMWCGPCNSAGAHAQEVQDLYADQDLIYVTVLIENREAMPPTEADIQQWVSDYGNTTSPVLAGTRGMLVSSGGTWELTSWPTFFYIDREMVIRDVDKGYSATEVLYSIEWLLAL
jgi:thiol-disulfide isomerase/thioredoxin|tara:strand:- start:972 stop:1580 length:609 start_codon:yes stop_codon:yes gene_type:complete